MGLSTFDAFKHIHADSLVVLTPEQLRSLQLVLADILDDFVAVCEKYNLNYSLSGGSCLGAVRHQGFIPWDDDIDVNMPRKDYLAFVQIFQQELGEKYWLHTPEATDNYALLLGRIRKKGTVVKNRDDFHCEECGAFIDIFIVENTFDSKLLRTLHGLGCQAFGLALSCRKFYRDRRQLLELVRDDAGLTRVFRIKIALGCLTALGSINFWTRSANRWSQLCKNENSRYVVIPAGRNRFFKETYLRSGFCRTKSVPFAGHMRNVPLDYDGYLTSLYGDYHVIPSAENQEAHFFFSFQI